MHRAVQTSLLVGFNAVYVRARLQCYVASRRYQRLGQQDIGFDGFAVLRDSPSAQGFTLRAYVSSLRNYAAIEGRHKLMLACHLKR